MPAGDAWSLWPRNGCGPHVSHVGSAVTYSLVVTDASSGCLMPVAPERAEARFALPLVLQFSVATAFPCLIYALSISFLPAFQIPHLFSAYLKISDLGCPEDQILRII